jgi:hypothetical protein
MGGKHLTILCTLSYNQTAISLKGALLDSGANGLVFIDTTLASQISSRLDRPLEPLPRSIPVRGYNGQPGSPASQYIRLNLMIDGQRHYNLPLIVLQLGSHEVIIGRKFFQLT